MTGGRSGLATPAWHAAIRGEAVAFDGNRAGMRGGRPQHVAIPPDLALEVLAGMNNGAVPVIELVEFVLMISSPRLPFQRISSRRQEC